MNKFGKTEKSPTASSRPVISINRDWVQKHK